MFSLQKYHFIDLHSFLDLTFHQQFLFLLTKENLENFIEHGSASSKLS